MAINRGLVAVCAATELELLTSARSGAEYEEILEETLPAFGWVPMGEPLWDRALDVQRALAHQGQHRCAFHT